MRGRIKRPPILVAMVSCLLRAPMRRNNEAMINTIMNVNSKNVKNAPASRFKFDRKYITRLKKPTPRSLTGKIETSEAMASIPPWYMANPVCFSFEMSSYA